MGTHIHGRMTQTNVVVLAEKYSLLFSEDTPLKSWEPIKARVELDTTVKPQTPTRKSGMSIDSWDVANCLPCI